MIMRINIALVIGAAVIVLGIMATVISRKKKDGCMPACIALAIIGVLIVFVSLIAKR